MNTRQELHPALSMRLYSKQPQASKLAELPVLCRGAFDWKQYRKVRLRELGTHAIYFGTTGSGKTTAMKLHMQSILRPPEAARHAVDANFRALVYDPKTDLVPFFFDMGFDVSKHVILTNPFDRRSSAWDVAHDVDNTARAETLADTLVPESKEDNPFWLNAAREIIESAVNGLNLGRERAGWAPWAFRQLIVSLLDPALLRSLLQRTATGEQVLADYLEVDGAGEMTAGVRASLRNAVAPYRLIAALWDRAATRFSFKRWRDGGGLIVIGENPEFPKQMVRTNNLLIRYALGTLLGRPDEVRHDLTWLYLDELRKAGRFPGFASILTEGRSKGLRAVLAAQGPSTLKATFEANEVDEVVNNCSEKCVMQLGTESDAKWAEENFSTTLRTKSSITISDRGKAEHSTSLRDEEEATLKARVFRRLRSADSTGRGLDAVYQWGGGHYTQEFTPGEAVARIICSAPQGARPPVAFEPRDERDYALHPLSNDERMQLGFSPQSEAAPEQTEPPTFRVPPPVPAWLETTSNS